MTNAMKMKTEDQKEKQSVSLTEAIQSLPVLDDEPYLYMQVMNLGIVDGFLVDLERQLLREYMETERTPLPDALLVSALSQLWIFGVYELLRTWRQRWREVLRFSDELEKLSGPMREAHIARNKAKLQAASPYSDDMTIPQWRSFERVANDRDFLSGARKAYASSEFLSRKIEALRVHLAKHEMPKVKGSIALAPGYGRIDMSNGSIYWQVLLRGNEVDLISRRDIADACRALVEDRSQYILPPDVQKKIAQIPESSYGAKRVTLKLSDGAEYHKVFVLWNKEVASVGDYEYIPFDVGKVVDVFEEPESS